MEAALEDYGGIARCREADFCATPQPGRRIARDELRELPEEVSLPERFVSPGVQPYASPGAQAEIVLEVGADVEARVRESVDEDRRVEIPFESGPEMGSLDRGIVEIAVVPDAPGPQARPRGPREGLEGMASRAQ